MAGVKYDPIKRTLGSFVGSKVILRKLFYRILGLMFLREWHVKRELRSLLSGVQNAKVFDAGSGFGQYSYYCARRFPGLSVLAVDVKEEQVADCKAFFQKAGIQNVDFAVEDLLEAKHTHEFDLVLAVDVMEHIKDDVLVFRNFYRALKAGGALLVNTPSNLGGSDAHSASDESFIGEHARVGYDMEEIGTKLESAGFAMQRLQYTYGRAGSIAWRIGIKIPMLMLNRSTLFFFLLPVYYAITLPVFFPLMYMDYVRPSKQGTGLLVVARKPK
ncbi:MAG: class I SAM-dependent methyltransferase [Ignavibacteriales bacterium]|nr:class I SAM-dependent methyltransferase [Ignavibacteriales bacterium]